MSIAIIDYGAGNLRSVQKAIETLGFSAEITKDTTIINNARGVILPGVGSFDSAIKELRAHQLETAIEAAVALNKPFLGICLGMQHLFERSEEGREKGLCLLKGTVKKFKFFGSQEKLSIPHMGWNRLLIKQKNPLLEGIEQGAMVYFAHSYHVVPQDQTSIIAATDHGYEFASCISINNLFGIQFHPEKSGDIGLQILKNFCKVSR